jgi:hypothetical protein
MCFIGSGFFGAIFGVWIVFFIGYKLYSMLKKAKNITIKLMVSLELTPPFDRPTTAKV